MADKREEIFQDLEDTLKTIKIANGYPIDVELVSRDLQHWEEVPPDRFPALFIVDGDEVLAYETVCTVGSRLRPAVVGYVRKELETSKEIHLLMKSVINALRKDLSRGGRAMVTYITEISTDRGSLRPYAAFEMTLEIRYRES